MKKITLALSLIALFSHEGFAQKKKKEDKKATKETTATTAPVTKMASAPADGFKTTENGLEYKITTDAPGGISPKIGDYVEVHLQMNVEDSTVFDTKQMNGGNAVQFPLQPPTFKGDMVEGIMMMTPGDVATFRLPVDTFIKAGTPVMPWMKPNTGQKLVYNISLVSVKTTEQMQKEQTENAAKQKDVDDKLIQDYLAANKVKATKTASGLYYKIDRAGTGVQAQAGKKVTVNYTGKLMDGEVFDSNVDPKFNHVQPFEFGLGQGQVIKGWDEGVALLKKGTKATLYIPSTLAYGANGQGPIKPNSVLVFDVEVVDVKDTDAKN